MSLRAVLLAPVLLLAVATAAPSELLVPGFTAYGSDPDGVRPGRRDRSMRWTDSRAKMLWFGKFERAGELQASVVVRLPKDAAGKWTLSAGGRDATAAATGTGDEQTVSFGAFPVPGPGYLSFALTPSGDEPGSVVALALDGPPLEGAHFNLDPRRNAASVHMRYPVPDGFETEAFYCEVTAVEDPLHTFYMACGFSRGYFGMQVNGPDERRIIFSVWDAAEGSTADDRSTVKEENHTSLLRKGDDVVSSVFGNEGTGGHSHLKYRWKTGSTQKFVVTARPEGTNTDYAGYWFHPDKNEWMLIAAFRAPKDGKFLRGLHSFSENFSGGNGHLRRKALYGNQWAKSPDGKWTPLTTAVFSHDATGKSNRLDRFMGVESDRFFLSHGGFVDGFTESGTRFSRPPSPTPPDLHLPDSP